MLLEILVCLKNINILTKEAISNWRAEKDGRGLSTKKEYAANLARLCTEVRPLLSELLVILDEIEEKASKIATHGVEIMKEN